MTTITEIGEGSHSILGASAAERWLNCPGSVLATKDLPDKSSQYAIEGNAAHTVSEWAREQNVSAKKFIGQVVRVNKADGHTDVTVTEDMAAAVDEFVDKVNEYEGDELIEVRVDYRSVVPLGFGTLDSGKLLPNVGRITDFKFGEGVKKHAEMNPQLMLYALGVYLEYNWLYDFKKFVLAISQPRLDHYDEWEILVCDLLTWAGTVAKPAAERALQPNAPFKAGHWCQFCKIKATCKVRAEDVFDTITEEFKDLDSAVAEVEGIADRVPTLTNDEVAKILLAWPNVEKFGSALKAHAASEVLAGRPVGDFKFVEGRGGRSLAVPEDQAIETILVTAPEVTRDKLFTKPELLSVAQLEKVVGKKYFAPGTEKKEPGKLHSLIRKVPGKATLVPGSDPRPVYSPDPTSDFSEVTEEV